MMPNLTDALRLKEALAEAERRLEEEFSEGNFLKLLEVLLLMGDMHTIRRYLNLWRRRKGEFPPSFVHYLALFYMRTLDIGNLKRVLPKLNVAVRALVHLKVFADPLKAMALAEGIGDDFIKARVMYEIGTVMGKPYPLPTPRSELEAISFKALRTLRDFFSGRLERAVRSVEEMVDRAVDSWLRPMAIHVKENELLLGGKVSDLYFLRLATHNLGLRRETERIKIYERFWGKEVKVDVPEEDRMLTTVLRLSDRARRRIHLPAEGSNLFGIEAFWWYASNVRRRRAYLSFSGRLRLMRGLEEVKLARRRALILLAFIRLKGYNFAKENAHIIFPDSVRPKRRVAEYLRYVREYLKVPIDVRIARRYGTFLEEEGEGWATFLREHVLNAER